MSLGFSTLKTDIDARSGQLSLTLRDTLRQIQIFEAWLAGTADATLTGMGYTSGEVAILKSAYVDMDKLRTVYEGTATQATTYDFRQFSKQLTGVV